MRKHLPNSEPRNYGAHLVNEDETRSVLGRLTREVIRQTGRCVLVQRLLRLLGCRTRRVVNLGAAEVAVFGTINVKIIEDALVVDALRVAASLVLEVGTALVQAVGILSKLFVARLLHHSEEVHRTVGDRLAFSQTFSRIVQLLATQQEFLQTTNGRD